MVQEETKPFYSLPDLSMETGFYGFDTAHQDSVDPCTKESINIVSGKLQSYCPTFFNSLSVWEREVINSLVWLKNVTTKVVSPLSIVKECTGNIDLPSRSLDPPHTIQNHVSSLEPVSASISQTLSSEKVTCSSPPHDFSL
jgi:hypothetical protein